FFLNLLSADGAQIRTTEDLPLLSAGDLTDFAGFRDQLMSGSSGSLSAYLWSLIPSTVQGDILNLARPESARKATLTDALNNLLMGNSIYNPAFFMSITLSVETNALRTQPGTLTGGELVRLNRMLLEDAYPLFIARNQDGQGVGAILD